MGDVGRSARGGPGSAATGDLGRMAPRTGLPELTAKDLLPSVAHRNTFRPIGVRTEEFMKRALLACATALAVTVGIASPAAAATPGALTPAQASAACAAYFGVPQVPEPLSACQWDM